MENLVKKFHDLGGATIPEHKKNYSLYLKELQKLNKTDRNVVIEALKPRNLQEELFYVKILLIHEKHEILQDVLLDGNKILNKLIVKDKRFIKYFARNVSPDKFVSDFCPKISFVCRINLLNRLAQVLESGDEYFDKIAEIYGLRQALNLLVACSEKKIKSLVEKYKISLNDCQLITIHKKYKRFLDCYFSTSRETLRLHEELVRYLLSHDLESFERLRVDYGTSKMGKKSFSKYFKNHRKFVLENPKEFQANYKAICRSLNHKEYYEYLKSFFPEDIDSFRFTDIIFKVLSRTKLENRGKLFFDIYYKLYGQNYDNINVEFLKIISIEDRQHFNLDSNYIFYPVTKSIPFIKEKINFTSDIHNRSKLVRELIETCKVNRDEGALLEVLKYCQRFKNDNVSLRSELATSLINNFSLYKLSDEHWKYIIEIILVFRVNNEDYYGVEKYLKEIILNKFYKNMDFLEDLRAYAEAIGTNNYGYWRISTNVPEDERKILLEFPKVLDTWKNKEDIDDAKIKFMSTLVDFNKANKKLKISLFGYKEYLRNTLYKIKETYFWNEILKELLRTEVGEDEDVLREEIIDRHLEGNYPSRTVFVWLLNNKPAKLKVITHKVILNMRYSSSRLYYELNKMHYTDLPRVFHEEALKILNDSEEKAESPAGIAQLSYCEDFFEIIKKFEPEDCFVDLHADNMRVLLAIQREILKALKNFARTTEALETIVKYCKKDYLQYALEPLYHAVYHGNQKQVEETLPVLITRAVSVRKHALFLATKLGTLRYIYDTLNSISKTEKNSSIKKFIFRCIYQTFLGNPDEYTLTLIKENLVLINEGDDESLELLVQVRKIPKEFQSKYVEIIWSFTKNLKKQLEFTIIRNLSEEVIRDLPDELLEEILRHSLFNPKNNSTSDTYNFVYNYLSPETKCSFRTKTLFTLIKAYSESTEDNSKKLSKISDLLRNVCFDTIHNNKKHIAENLSQNFAETSINIPTYSIKILLNFTLFYVKNDRGQFPKYFLNQLNLLVDEYGSAVVQFFVDSSEDFLEKIYWENNTDRLSGNVKFVEDLLDVADSAEAKLVCLCLLPAKTCTKKVDLLKRIDVILDVITREPLVQIYYSSYLLK